MGFLPYNPKTLKQLVDAGDYETIRNTYIINTILIFVGGLLIGWSLAGLI